MKKRFGLGWILGVGLAPMPVALLTIQAVVMPGMAMAQADTTATVHGHANDPGGTPITKGEVKFTTDRTSAPEKRIYRYTFSLDNDGNYTATGIVPANYLVQLFQDGKSIDYQDNVVLKIGDSKVVNFDMTREEYLKTMTPEQRKALEELKKKNAAAMSENAKIADVNKTLIQARADEKEGKSDAAIAALTPLTTQKPDEPVVWAALGEAQLANADAAAAAARAAKTPATTPEIYQKYADAAASYQKAVDTNDKKPKPIMEVQYAAYLNMGQALGRSGKPDEAGAAFENAAKANPAQAGTALYNEAATYFNNGKSKEAAAAADKAIAADPKRAEAYYIKASSLVGDAKEDEKTKLFVLPPGCLEAYQEYLELAPNGPHAADVKGLLDSLKQPQKNSFKAKK